MKEGTYMVPSQQVVFIIDRDGSYDPAQIHSIQFQWSCGSFAFFMTSRNNTNRLGPQASGFRAPLFLLGRLFRHHLQSPPFLRRHRT